jgi:hypothetical protein
MVARLNSAHDVLMALEEWALTKGGSTPLATNAALITRTIHFAMPSKWTNR